MALAPGKIKGSSHGHDGQGLSVTTFRICLFISRMPIYVLEVTADEMENVEHLVFKA